MTDRADENLDAGLGTRAYLFILIVLLLAGLLPIILSMVVRSEVDIGATVILALLSVLGLSAWQLARLASRRTPHLLGITFWCFVYVTVGLVPVVQLSFDAFPWPGEYSDSEVTSGLVLVLTASVAFLLGHRGGRMRSQESTAGGVDGLSAWRTVGLALLGCVSTAALIGSLGGVGGLFVSRVQFLEEITARVGMAGYAVVTTTSRSIPLVSALGLAYLIRHRIRSGRRRGLLIGLWMTSSVFALVVGNPVISPRFWSGTVMGALIIAWPFFRQEVRPWVWVFGSIAAFSIAFPAADLFRVAAPGEVLSGQYEVADLTSPVLDAFRSGDFDVFQQSINASRVVSAEGIDFGRQFFGSLLFWVPRELWPGKPVHSGEYVAEQLGYVFTNVGFPLWSESFLAFAWPGVIATFLLYGYLAGYLDRAYCSQEGGRLRTSAVGPFVAVLAPYQFFLLRGALLPVAAFITPTIILILLLANRELHLGFCRPRQPGLGRV